MKFKSLIIVLLGLCVTLNAQIVSTNGIATDSATGLVWQDDSKAKIIEKDWNGAKSYCENLTLGGYSDWRLPNIFELTTLLDNTKWSKPYILDNIENIASGYYWSSSISSQNYAWYVNFVNGLSMWGDKTYKLHLRCVKGKQLIFDDLSLLKKNDKIKTSQKNINRIPKKEESEDILNEEKIISKESNSINSSVNTKIVTKDDIAKPLKQEPVVTESKPKVIVPVEPTIKENIQKEKTISKKESNQSIFSDSATGLVWQDNSEAKTNKKDWNGAKSYCENLTLGGYSDWRLPNIFELTTLLDNTKSEKPYVVDGIKNIASYDYWSSTTDSANIDIAWFVGFNYGGNSWHYKTDDNSYVRCVRAGELTFDDLVILKNKGKLKVSQKRIDEIRLKILYLEDKPKEEEKIVSKKELNQNTISGIVSTNDIATDNTTGLIWQDDSEAATNKENWMSAKKYCQNLTLGGYSDWRLPNIFELSTLIDNTKSEEPYVVDGIKNIDSVRYWSSSTFVDNIDYAWRVRFNMGDEDMESKRLRNYVRCVSGKELSFDDLSLLKKSGKIKVSQENIDRIKP